MPQRPSIGRTCFLILKARVFIRCSMVLTWGGIQCTLIRWVVSGVHNRINGTFYVAKGSGSADCELDAQTRESGPCSVNKGLYYTWHELMLLFCVHGGASRSNRMQCATQSFQLGMCRGPRYDYTDDLRASDVKTKAALCCGTLHFVQRHARFSTFMRRLTACTRGMHARASWAKK